MEKTRSIWLDGALVPWDDAAFHFFTHTLHYGVGVFEGVRCYHLADGRSAIFRLKEHVRRLFDSAKVCLMKLPFSETEVAEGCRAVVKDSGLPECYLRPLAWMGEGSMGIASTTNPIHVGVGVFSWGPYLGKKAKESGIRCAVSSLSRISNTSHLTRAKICGQYVNSVLANRAAVLAGYDEAILLDADGRVAEGSGENIFVVRDGVLKTPPLSAPILAGITRESILELARAGMKRHGIRAIVEESFPREELYMADEAFFTGTAAEVTPIIDVDGRAIGTGRPGKVTLSLAAAFEDAVHGRDPERAHWLSVV